MAQKHRGVTWERPLSVLRAAADLKSMANLGITAVRTGPVTEELLLVTADSLGITLYRELPFYEYPAARLVDSTAAAGLFLNHLIRSGSGHSSAGPIGLAVRADVSAAEACAYFSQLRSAVESSREQLFYYVSTFIEADVCADFVDFVMIDATDNPDPAAMILRWNAIHTTPPAVTVGWWTDTGISSGLQIPNSPESQARNMESSLGELMGDSRLVAVFVHRWRDQLSGVAPTGTERGDVYGRAYGLQDETDIARPVMHVVTGIFSGGQSVFALPRDPSEPSPEVWYLLMGWLLIGIVAALYSSSPRFRYMTPRYFIAHGFYRNAVREAREVLPIVSTALLSVVGISIGMIATQFMIAVHDTAPVIHLVKLMPSVMEAALAVLIKSPVIATFFLGSLALLQITVWMGLWMIVGLRKAALLPSQALMIAVWPQWQLLLLLPVTMSIFTLESESLLIGMLLVLPVWIGSSLWAGGRTAYDVFKLTRCSPLTAVLGWLLHPTVLLLLILIAVATKESEHFWYFVHLVSRS